MLLRNLPQSCSHKSSISMDPSSSVDCISLQPDNQQDSSSSRVDHSALGEQTLVSFKLFLTRPWRKYCRWRVSCHLVLYSMKWVWPLTVHDLSTGALLNCETMPPPSSVIDMYGRVPIQHGWDLEALERCFFFFLSFFCFVLRFGAI